MNEAYQVMISMKECKASGNNHVPVISKDPNPGYASVDHARVSSIFEQGSEACVVATRQRSEKGRRAMGEET